jgi:hypothetical protein
VDYRIEGSACWPSVTAINKAITEHSTLPVPGTSLSSLFVLVSLPTPAHQTLFDCLLRCCNVLHKFFLAKFEPYINTHPFPTYNFRVPGPWETEWSNSWRDIQEIVWNTALRAMYKPNFDYKPAASEILTFMTDSGLTDINADDICNVPSQFVNSIAELAACNVIIWKRLSVHYPDTEFTSPALWNLDFIPIPTDFWDKKTDTKSRDGRNDALYRYHPNKFMPLFHAASYSTVTDPREKRLPHSTDECTWRLFRVSDKIRSLPLQINSKKAQTLGLLPDTEMQAKWSPFIYCFQSNNTANNPSFSIEPESLTFAIEVNSRKQCHYHFLPPSLAKLWNLSEISPNRLNTHHLFN